MIDHPKFRIDITVIHSKNRAVSEPDWNYTFWTAERKMSASLIQLMLADFDDPALVDCIVVAIADRFTAKLEWYGTLSPTDLSDTGELPESLNEWARKGGD